MDEFLLEQFLSNKGSRLVIHFPNDIDWWSFYLELKRCGWEFTSPLNRNRKLDGGFLVWIKNDKVLWFTSLSANEEFLTLSEFKRSYNLFTLL